MSTPSKKRLMRDFRRLQNDPPQGISAAPLQDNIMEWQAVTFGPDDSPWEGGTFKLTLSFTEDYPNKAPKVKFITKMFHPNIYNDGAICLDILQHNWSPIYDIAAILTSIQSLLTDPNPNSPANVEAAKLYQENRREYERRVQQVVEESWEQDSDDDDDNEDDNDDEDDDDDENEDDSDDLDLSDDDDDDNNTKNKTKNKTKSATEEKEDIDVETNTNNANNSNNSDNNNNNNNNSNNANDSDIAMTGNSNENSATNNTDASATMASAANS